MLRTRAEVFIGKNENIMQKGLIFSMDAYTYQIYFGSGYL